jgi:diaminohydroxyphosphoribosylaminopyrimidine deaminase/5-amino-6-(5-phosphoribosylamino)uracil reductase
LLRAAGIEVQHGLLAEEAANLNRAFNRWIQTRLPYVTLKAAMTLDGKMATSSGESKWITGEPARRRAMTLRRGVDAILIGVRTVLADDPSLTVRAGVASGARSNVSRQPLRMVLDSRARTPLSAHLLNDPWADRTVIVTTEEAPRRRVAGLAKRVRVITSPELGGRVDLAWLMRLLGEEGVTSLLVEGGGEVHAGFLDSGLAQEVAFFYAPKILGGRQALRAVGGVGAQGPASALLLEEVRWRRTGQDLLLNARIQGPTARPRA